jgi:hypothetical protein
MAGSKIPQPQVQESEDYENLIAEVDSVEEYQYGHQAPKPKKSKSDYPHTLKVHTWTRGDTDKLAVALGRRLSSDKTKFVYRKRKPIDKDKCVYVEKRKNPFKKSTTHRDRIESQLWKDTVEYVQDGWSTYITFHITFENETQYLDFCKKIKIRVGLTTSSVTFPPRKPRVWKYEWRCRNKVQPHYPMYIVSKGRGDSRLTSRCFERIGVPYYIVIEPQDYDEYACVIDEDKILVLPFSNHGDGPGRARNWCWDHSKANGFKRHWVFDDNIEGFHRIYRNRIYPVADGGMFRVIEEFVDRFKNVPVSGLQYDFFTLNNNRYSPFVLNTRIYSALLIENSCPHRWRGRYNEDTILSLDVLKDGMCTMQFNCLLQGKAPTQQLGGGNSAEFYSNEGTYNKSRMLEVIHPDVARVEWRYGRWHHHVNYRPFKNNPPKYVDGYDPENNRSETDLFVFDRVKV